MHKSTKQRWLASIGAVAAVATLASGGVLTASAADDIANPNSAMGYPTFYTNGQTGVDPIPANNGESDLTYDPSTSYLKEVFDNDVANGAGTDTDHDFWIDSILRRDGAAPTGTGTNEAGDYRYEGSDSNSYLFTRGRAAYMYTHTPGQLGFVGNFAYWDQTGKSGYTITVDGQTLREVTSERKQTPSYFTTVFQNSDKTLTVTETKYITYSNVLVTNLTFESTTDRDVTVTAESSFADTGADGASELTGRVNATNNLTTLSPRFSGNGFTVADGKLVSTMSLKAGEAQTTKVQLGMIADELPDSTTEYEARFNGDLTDPAASYQDSVTEYNAWWYENIPYIETPEHAIDKTVVYRWWLSRFNMIDADMPGNTFQYPTSIEGVLGYNNQIVLTSGMFINDTKWLRNAEYSYGTWVSAGQTAKKGQSGYYYYHDNPGDPANWNHSYTQYITKAGWDSYKVHGGPSSLAEALGDYGSDDVKGLLASKSEPDGNDNQNNNENYLIDWSWNSMTGNDADAVSFSEYPGERMDRADGSANMWANAVAAAEAYTAAGDDESAAEMQAIADAIKADVIDELWNEDTELIQHKFIGSHDGDFAQYKEINNYYPYSVGLMPTSDDADYDDDYEAALRLFADADEFPIFPFFTANQADKKALNFPGSNNFAIINATPLLQIYSAGIRDYNANDNEYITNESFKKLLYWVAFAHYQGGDTAYPDQNEFWNMDNNTSGTDIPSKNKDASENGGKITYRSWIHHTQLGTTNWTIIEDVAGMVPREDNKIELNPIEIPDWDYFTVNNLSYHDQDLSIVWDKDGSQYGGPAGYTLYLDGKAVFTSDKLAHLIYDPTTGTVEDVDNAGAQITNATTANVVAANQVTYDSDSRVTDIFAKSGQNIDSASRSQVDVAEGADVEATYETSGYPATNAVDGKNVMESFWGTKGSKNAKDSITVTFKDGAKTIDDVRLYFYQTSSSQTISGYAEPSVYTLEYQDASGAWHEMTNQVRTPTYPEANYNRVQFDAVEATAIRATFTAQAGQAVGLKEIEAYDTGIKATETAENQAPSVEAYVASSTSSGAELVGTAKDDGLPNGTMSAKWEQVSGPEGGVAKFADDTAASTMVTFNMEGDYTLKLTVTDGEKSGEVTLTVHGIPSDGTVNIGSQAEVSVSSQNSYPVGGPAILNDGVVDLEGADTMKSWNNWGAGDKEPTVTYEWAGEVPVSKVQAYFWTDGGGVPLPDGWKVQYDEDGEWKDVTLKSGQSYDVTKSQGVSVSFEQVWTSKIRVVFTPKSGPQAVGLSELEVYAADPMGIDDVYRLVKTGTSEADLDLPSTVSAYYADGTRAELTVTWPGVSDDELAKDGNDITLNGTVAGALTGVKATIAVRSDADKLSVNSVVPMEQTVYQNSESFEAPATVTLRYMNGAQNGGYAVEWDADDLAAVDLTTIGDYEVSGTVADAEGYPAKLTVHVVANPNGGGTTDPDPEPGPDPEPEPLEGWIEGLASSVSTSHAASWSPAGDKLNDGVLVDDSWPSGDDQDVNSYVWGSWGVATDGMYAEYRWDEAAEIDSSRVQFWANFAQTDDAKGGLEIPDAWTIQYLAEDGSWVDVTPTADGGYTTVRNSPAERPGDNDGWSTVTFEPVTTTALRLVLTPHTGTGTFGAAVAEWGVHALENEEPEPPTVDKSALESAIKAAESVSEALYTPQSWAKFTQAIADAKAVFDAADATQEQVNAAVTALDDAQKALVKQADKTTLANVIAEAEALDEADYTEATWATLADALEAATALAADENADQSAVDNAAAAVREAIDALETKTPTGTTDKSALSQEIAKATSITRELYTDASLARLDTALADAEQVMADDDASQPEIDAAYSNLAAAYNALEKKDQGTVDRANLLATIKNADALAGKEADYTAASWKRFKAAYDEARAIAADATADQKAVDQAAAKLADAIRKLEAVTPAPGETVNKSALNATIAKAEALDLARYEADGVKALSEALAAAKAVAADADATQDDVDAAAKALDQAIKALKERADAPGAGTLTDTGVNVALIAIAGVLLAIAGAFVLNRRRGASGRHIA